MHGDASCELTQPEEIGAAQDFMDAFLLDSSDDADHVSLLGLKRGSVGSKDMKGLWTLASMRRQRMPIVSVILVLLTLVWFVVTKAPFSFFQTLPPGWLPLLRGVDLEHSEKFFHDHLAANDYLRPDSAKVDIGESRSQLAAMIITRQRPNGVNYLPAGLWFFHRSVRAHRMFSWDVVVCDADYDDLPRPSVIDRVQQVMNVTVNSLQEQRRRHHLPLTRVRSTSNEAKRDYGGCLNMFAEHLKTKKSGVPYAMVFEDDAIALDNLETSVSWLLARPELQSRRAGYVKFWNPRWYMRFKFVLHVLGFNAIVGLAITVVLLRRNQPRRRTAVCFGAATFVALLVVYLVLHDDTLSLLMTLIPSMHALQHSSDCCTIGMLYETSLLAVLGERMVTDTGNQPYDHLMYDFVYHNLHRDVLQVFPYAVEHIGRQSSIDRSHDV